MDRRWDSMGHGLRRYRNLLLLCPRRWMLWKGRADTPSAVIGKGRIGSSGREVSEKRGKNGARKRQKQKKERRFGVKTISSPLACSRLLMEWKHGQKTCRTFE